MSSGLIANRDEFYRVLNETSDIINDLVEREPGYPTWKEIQQQLRAMKLWSATGDPTPEQRARISIGLITVRELEMAAQTPELDDLIDRLHRLSYAWKYWPPTGQPKT